MFTHVVLFKYKEGVKNEDIEEVERLFTALPGKIAEIRRYEFGRDIMQTERSYDLGLISAFDDLKAYEVYRDHPKHKVIIKKNNAICESVITVDFET